VAAYLALIAPLTAAARSHSSPAGGVTSLSDAVQCLDDGWKDFGQPRSKAQDDSVLGRFSAAPLQAFLVQQYDEGRPGDSLQSIWTAAVPRVLWPDKPNVTRFGAELYGLVNNTSNGKSALAPTYTAEAYWNGGWPAVVLVSILVGLELGWLTRRWLRLAQGRSSGLGILIMAIPAALLAFWVESWIAATFVGGFVTLAILINALDVATRAVARPRPRWPASARLVPGGRP